ncbi:ATPase with chaperone activity [Zwartia vadi]|uniref:ATPase with chaperone activity n=1 Tax=Zwartia vadi TaxID=3058168 RepID=UPI0025B3D1D5|nr:ATPase with chaperone activity [Zwartia vadi]MDN3987819.1 ATPase with chaperone activity [Zwartia vadi]
MSDGNQIIIPPSFIALFVEPGRIKPSASREHIYARYDLCEDLANLLTEQATNKLWELGITEDDVLERIHQGLGAVDIGLSSAEAQWVICRLAEILGWQQANPRSQGETRERS